MKQRDAYLVSVTLILRDDTPASKSMLIIANENATVEAIQGAAISQLKFQRIKTVVEIEHEKIDNATLTILKEVALSKGL